MKRTKEWWSRLNKWERTQLVGLEKAANVYGRFGGYLPDDCSECSYCGNPMFSSGLCGDCSKDLTRLIRKADGTTK